MPGGVDDIQIAWRQLGIKLYEVDVFLKAVSTKM